jgi:hypothetical protein
MTKNTTVQILLYIAAAANIIAAILDIVDNNIQHGVTGLILAAVFVLLAIQRKTDYKHTERVKKAALILLGIALVNVVYMIVR